MLPLVLVSSNLTYAEIKLPGVDRPVTLNRAAWGDPVARTAAELAAAGGPLDLSEPASASTSVRVFARETAGGGEPGRDLPAQESGTAYPDLPFAPPPIPPSAPNPNYPAPNYPAPNDSDTSGPGSKDPDHPDGPPSPAPDDPNPSPDDPTEPSPPPDDSAPNDPTPSPEDPSPTPSPDDPAPRPQRTDPDPTDSPSYPPEPEPEPKPEICILLPKLPICIGLPG